MGKYANFYDGVRKLLDKVADALDPDGADVKTANYQTAVLDSLERIGDKVGDVVDATLPDPSEATDGDVLTVDDGEWVIGSGGGGTGGTMVITGIVSGGGSHVTLDKTWKEIFDAMTSGIVPVVMWDEVAGDDTYKYREPVDCANGSAGQYNVHTYNGDFFIDTENGYPDMYRD